jgi:urease accessory protein
MLKRPSSPEAARFKVTRLRPRRTASRLASSAEAQPLGSALLPLMWLASPALPIGGFSYSEGLEAAIDAAAKRGEVLDCADWLADQLHLSLARGDLAVLAKALPAWRRGDVQRLCELNNWVLHTRESAEFRLQTEQMGRSMVLWLLSIKPECQAQIDAFKADPIPTDALTPHTANQDQPSLSYPLAFALAASTSSASVHDCLLSYAFGWAENMASAAVKAVPLGQTAGQRILAQLADAIPAAVAHAISLQDSERQAFTPMLAILSAQHETQYSRLFRS